MKRYSLFIIFLLLLFYIGCKEDEKIDPNYPTIIKKASDEKVDEISKRLYESPLYECTSIDSFGYCIVSLKNRDCGRFDSIYVRYSKEEIIRLFYQSVFNYRDLLNITDTSGIMVSSIKNLRGTEFNQFYKTYPDSIPQGWIITSNLQKIDGYDIPGTKIQVLISFDQVRSIGGKRYEKVYIPTTDIISEDSAKACLINVEMVYKNTKFIPSVETYWYDSEKIIFPVIKSDRIELRVCWSLFPGSWQVIVDSQTGKVLSSINIDKI